ncbi:hypothetical protein KY290_010662 [Solanum tuberosum]|uniref:Secreted protein n=1 Tax=Solanum tuberosum TaxID=4113 RepID=A0ABQ7VYZ4_SOLTU|nr:hypothetical protein KY290_010662 [Solanum tuberosum]
MLFFLLSSRRSVTTSMALPTHDTRNNISRRRATSGNATLPSLAPSLSLPSRFLLFSLIAPLSSSPPFSDKGSNNVWRGQQLWRLLSSLILVRQQTPVNNSNNDRHQPHETPAGSISEANRHERQLARASSNSRTSSD